jgi:hypothetical protein
MHAVTLDKGVTVLFTVLDRCRSLFIELDDIIGLGIVIKRIIPQLVT